MRGSTVQTFCSDDRWHDALDHGVLVVEASKLVAKEEDRIRLLYGDQDEDGDDYFVEFILPLGKKTGSPPRVCVLFSDSDPQRCGQRADTDNPF